MRVVPLNYVMVKEAGLVDPLLINKWPNDGKSRIINYESRGAAKFNLKDYIGAVKDFENEIHDMEIFIKEFYLLFKNKVNKSIADTLGFGSTSSTLDRNLGFLHDQRGRARFLIKDFKGAIEDYNSAMITSRHKYNDSLYYFRGNAKMELKDYQGAFGDYSIAIQTLKEDNPTSLYHYGKGNALMKLDDLKGALIEYTKYIESSNKPLSRDPFTGKYIESSNKELLRDPYNNRGFVKMALHDFKGAIEDCTKAIEIDPEFSNAYFYRGLAKLCLGVSSPEKKFLTESIEDYNKAIEIDPKFSIVYHFRGISKMKMDESNNNSKGGACLDFDKALKLGYSQEVSESDDDNDFLRINSLKPYEIKEYCQEKKKW